MQALVLEAYSRLTVKEVSTPEPAPHEVLVRVRSVGICGSDVHGYDGTSGRRIPPLIMGHEASGEIAGVGEEVSGWRTGDRVTFDSTIYRLEDWFSRRGRYNLSQGRRVLGVSCDEYRRDGAFAEYVTVPAHVLYRLPPELSFDHAALTEPLAVALHGVSLTPIAVGDVVAVVGAGVIGLLTVAALRARGCAEIIVSDPAEARLEKARGVGATHVLDPTRESLAEVCAACTDGRGADAVIEAVGLEPTVDAAIQAVRRGGTVTILGNITPQVSIPLQRVVAGEIRLQGSCAICNEYPAALTLLQRDAVGAESLISTRAPLSEAPALFERLHAGDPELTKVILKP